MSSTAETVKTAAKTRRKSASDASKTDKGVKAAEVVLAEALPESAPEAAQACADAAPKLVAAETKSTAKNESYAKEDETPSEIKPKMARDPKEGASTKKSAAGVNIILQFSGESYSQEKLVASAKDVWVYDLGKDLKDFKSVDLYVKPEERHVYAVVNGAEQLDFVL